MKNTVFSCADILLPPYSPEEKGWESYAVIACDQFTSEPEYWEKVRELSKDSLSTLGLILPEAYLGTDKEKPQRDKVRENMKTVKEKLVLHKDCLIYVERALPTGKVRCGIVGKLDLEGYDFTVGSKKAVRATEETVIERIPPRVAVRKEAEVELPHVMVFANDREKLLFKPLSEEKDKMELVYSARLMLGGGDIKGYKIEGELLSRVLSLVAEYEEGAKSGLVYAMGDGNHSLASAKAHFEDIKKELGEEAMDHPARYALVELVDLYDESIEFEPIYRLLCGEGAEGIFEYIGNEIKENTDLQTVVSVVGDEEREVAVPALHALNVGSLQMLIDGFIAKNEGVSCDYIHGKDSLRKLSRGENRVGFFCDGVEKEELFDYVARYGTLPRKTFSMGEAVSKRYYLEARNITK